MRSAAEIPVVAPSRASMDSQNAVPKFDVLSGRHERQPQLVAPLGGEGQADQAAAVGGHEVDDLGRDFFRRDGEVAFVFAVFVVDNYEHSPRAEILDGFWNGCKRHN